MDPQTRKRKLIDEYFKDSEIARLKKELLLQLHSHKFYECMNSNNQRYISVLHKKMHETLPDSELIKLGDAMNHEFQNFAKANRALRTKFSTFKTSLLAQERIATSE